MKAHIFATVLARNGKELYKELECFGLNLTDMGAEQLVYGDIKLADVGAVVQVLSRYGNVKFELTRN